MDEVQSDEITWTSAVRACRSKQVWGLGFEHTLFVCKVLTGGFQEVVSRVEGSVFSHQDLGGSISPAITARQIRVDTRNRIAILTRTARNDGCSLY